MEINIILYLINFADPYVFFSINYTNCYTYWHFSNRKIYEHILCDVYYG